jgi:phosphotriesterase-related protein
MPTVETVLGPIDDAALGNVLSHEHVLSGMDRRIYPWRYNGDAAKRRSVEELTEAKRGGIDTVIDLTTPDLGRDVTTLAELSRASGMNVIAATGIWLNPPNFFWTREPDEIAELFVHEIEVGIELTNIKAGAIKVANDVEGVTPLAERILRGAARACNATGCPISTHHAASLELGRRQVEIFQDEGVQMDRVCIGHSADTTNLDYLEALLNAGVYLSMDRYPGSGDHPTWQERNATVKALIDRGWAERLMLGHDYAPARILAGAELGPSSEPTRYLFVSTVAIPALLEAGVSAANIDLMMREVPRRFLTGVAS